VIAGVADTHALIWYLTNDRRLSLTAKQFLESSAQNGDQIGVSAISLVEMVYLIEKACIASESLTSLAYYFDEPSSMFIEIPLNLQIVRTLSRISSTQIPDMPDRIIAATALHLDVLLVSRDGKIQLSTVTTIW
jgi:PIN domain nuclease of toxin-antitoxin system